MKWEGLLPSPFFFVNTNVRKLLAFGKAASSEFLCSTEAILPLWIDFKDCHQLG